MVDAIRSLSESEREKLRAAVDAARASTSAKFEFVIVPASEHYSLYPIVWSAVLSLTIAGALALARPHLSIGAGFIANAAAFLVLAVVLDWWPLRLRLVPGPAKRAAAQRMAFREFSTRLISKDAEQNGVMLFVSLAERHLQIIAERDAHASVPAGTWDRIVTDATGAMGARGLTEGLLGAISACATALAAAFPARTTP